VARSLPETLNEAVRATVWERDQEAWNLPRATREPIARNEDGHESEADRTDPYADDGRLPPASPGSPNEEASVTARGELGSGTIQLLRGRFESRFESVEAARAAARDARAVGFAVDVEPDGVRWLAVGRRTLAFPDDERARYASRLHAIAVHHGGAFCGFVEESSSDPSSDRAT
jgi:hypothetical protein